MTPNQKKAFDMLKAIRDVAEIKNEIRRLHRDGKNRELADLALNMADTFQIIFLEKISKL